MTEVLAIISALTALAAVLLGPLVSIWVAQKQVRVSVLSNNRQQWINTLRDIISEYFSIVAIVLVTDWDGKPRDEHDQKMERLMLLNSKIRLMLNPKEDDHIKLVELLGDLAEQAASARSEMSKDKMRASHNEAVLVAQKVLKGEWERVKSVR